MKPLHRSPRLGHRFKLRLAEAGFVPRCDTGLADGSRSLETRRAASRWFRSVAVGLRPDSTSGWRDPRANLEYSGAVPRYDGGLRVHCSIPGKRPSWLNVR
jgi:hypothetical protein